MMKPTQVAMYARVSSEQQAEAHTVASQVAAVRERVAADGLTVSEAMQFESREMPGVMPLSGSLRPQGPCPDTNA